MIDKYIIETIEPQPSEHHLSEKPANRTTDAIKRIVNILACMKLGLHQLNYKLKGKDAMHLKIGDLNLYKLYKDMHSNLSDQNKKFLISEVNHAVPSTFDLNVYNLWIVFANKIEKWPF